MKRLYIHGSFMNDNYGDFLLYYVMLKECEKYSEYYNIFSSDIDASYDKYCAVSRKNKIISVMTADVAIFSGGGYFGEPSKRKMLWNIRCIFKHLLPVYIIAVRKIPYSLYGLEMGPLSFKISKLLLKKICNNARDISVRNEESRTFLKRIGVKKDVKMIPDLVIGMDEKMLLSKGHTDAEAMAKRLGKYEKLILVHLTTSKDQPGMRNVIEDLAKFSSENEDIKFMIVCDQKRETQVERANNVHNNFPRGKSMVVEYAGPFVLSNLINMADAVVTDKLHVGIVATKLGKEVISAAAHPKTARFYKTIKKPEWSRMLDSVKAGDIYKALVGLKNSHNDVDKDIFVEAKHNYALIDDFLEENK